MYFTSYLRFESILAQTVSLTSVLILKEVEACSTHSYGKKKVKVFLFWHHLFFSHFATTHIYWLNSGIVFWPPFLKYCFACIVLLLLLLLARRTDEHRRIPDLPRWS